MNNLAGNPAYAEVLTGLRKNLKKWMQEQGHQGHVFGNPLEIRHMTLKDVEAGAIEKTQKKLRKKTEDKKKKEKEGEKGNHN